MQRILRGYEEGVASAVATMFVLLLILLFMQATIIAAVPAQQYAAEYNTAQHDLQELDFLRSMAAGPAIAGTQFSVPFQLGTAAVSPFATASQGSLSLVNDGSGVSVSFGFVPQFRQVTVTKTLFDVVILLDISGSMDQSDPSWLRVKSAQAFVTNLTQGDCVAIVAYNGVSYLTQTNVAGGIPHHLYYPGMCGTPDYSQPKADLGTITANSDDTNIGLAIATGNNELIANGNPKHTWVEILLTDGNNCCGSNTATFGDPYTRAQANISKAHGITIYTIGLGSAADTSLLSWIAADTAGSYYFASTASQIRWIYLEISMKFKSTFLCGNVQTAEAYGGALALNLSATQYPSQSLRFESGGVAVVQSTGAAMYEGLPMQYTPTPGGSGSLQISLISIVGKGFTATGGTTRVINAQVLGRELVTQSLTAVNLSQEAANVGSIVANVTSWSSQGAATTGAENAVNAPLNQAQTSLNFAYGNVTRYNYVGAQKSVNQAQSQLWTAINVSKTYLNSVVTSSNNMQNWLINSTIGSITLESCRLTQWNDYYYGLTVTITTTVPQAWGAWVNSTFPGLRIPFGLSFSANTVTTTNVVISIRFLNQIITDQRVISLSVS